METSAVVALVVLVGIVVFGILWGKRQALVLGAVTRMRIISFRWSEFQTKFRNDDEDDA